VRDELLQHYQDELVYLHRMGAEFAEKYPSVADRLLLKENECEDPHVKRLIEGFAFLAARIHLKLHDEFPEMTESLLGILYPHYVRPIPAMTIVEFQLDPEQGSASRLSIPPDTLLYTDMVDGQACKFRTCYDTALWPVSVAQAQWTTPDRLRLGFPTPDAPAALRIELNCLPDFTFDKLATAAKLPLDALRFYLSGDDRLVHALYELLCNNCAQVYVRDPTPKSKFKPVLLDPDSLRPVGFAEDQGILPYSRRSFIGYRLLQEYFAFPEKFLFLELSGLQPAFAAGLKNRAELIFLISRFERRERQQTLEMGVSERTFRLGCAPIVNLFEHEAEPVLVNQTRHEYPIIPDAWHPRAIEIFSIEKVRSSSPQSSEVIDYEPFYSYRHGTVREKKQTFWHATRRPSPKRDDAGTDLYLSLVDLSGRPARPDLDTISVRCLCTNRDLISRLPFGSEDGDFEMEGFPAVKRVMALHTPTSTQRPPLGQGLFWRLISHLSLNYLSLVAEGKEALQEILKLYNFSGDPALQKQISGILSLGSRPHFARVISDNDISFLRGTRVEMEFDEGQFVGGSVYLFASVLEHFLGLWASLNSFSQLVVRTPQRKEVLREWPPRAGRQILL